MADWSDLPDVYVTKVECQQGMFWRVEACSVPMVTLPECRLIRADVVAAKDKAHEKEITVWSENYAALERQLAEAREALTLILPLAKGYAAVNRHDVNRRVIEIAEAVLT